MKFMTRKIYLFLIIFLLKWTPGFGQEVWPLKKCIDYALANNLNLRQNSLSIKQAEVNLASSKESRYPSLNYNLGGGFRFGRTIDFASNTFVNESTNFNFHDLSTNVPIYQGGRISNSIRQSVTNVQAAEYDVKQIGDNLALQVSVDYLEILLNIESLDIAKRRLENSKKQLEQTDKLINAGSLPRNDRLNLVAQQAREEESIIIQENAINIAYLNLKNDLNLNPDDEIQLQSPDVESMLKVAMVQSQFDNLFNTAINQNNGLKAAELRVEAAMTNEKISKAGGLPSLSLGGNVSTNYSSSIKEFSQADNSNAVIVPLQQSVLIDNNPSQLTFFQLVGTSYPNKPIGNQLVDNLGQNISVNLAVPIYNGRAAHYNHQQARIGTEQAKFSQEISRQSLRTTVYRALNDFNAAKGRLAAAEKEYEAAKGALDNIEKRFNAGSSNSLDLITSKNNFYTSEDNLLTAKYRYIFLQKTLAFYAGQPFEL